MEPLVKTKFSGEVVAVLAPSHGQIPLYRARLPGQLVRGSRAELPSLPRPERSFWPHCDDVVRMTEVPLHVPGTQRGREERPRSTSRSPPRVHMIQEEDEFEVPYFDAEAALAAARRERTQRAESTERGRPLGQGDSGTREDRNDRDDPESKLKRSSKLQQEVVLEHSKDGQCLQAGQTSQTGEMPRGQGESSSLGKDPKGAEVRTLSIPSREPSLERDKAAQAACSRSLAQAEAMMMASIRPRPRAPRLQLVGRPPVVEVEAPQAAQRRIPDRRVLGDAQERGRSPECNTRMSLMAPRPKKSPRDHRAREKIGKLLVAHYEVRTRNEAKKWSRMLMRVILAGEEKNPDALVEGISLLQNAQNLIGAEESGESSAKSRVVLQALCLVDRKVKVRSPLADAVRTLEELTKRKEKLLVDMTSMGAEEAAVDIHLEDTEPTFAENLKRSWQEVHREATAWPPLEKQKESATAKNESRLKKKTEAEKEAAVEQMKKSMGTAVWRFAQAEAKKMEADAEAMDQTNGTDGDGKDADTDLGEEALQRAARIEYAIKAAVEQSVDAKHPDLLKALQITYDLRAFRAMRYCQHLMSTIEPGVVGSAGKIANMIDQVIQDASELYSVPKDHRHMEEARRLVLKARTEEAQAKRRDKR